MHITQMFLEESYFNGRMLFIDFIEQILQFFFCTFEKEKNAINISQI